MSKIGSLRMTFTRFSHAAYSCNEGHFTNPCLSLQRYLDIPLFKKNEVLFEPSKNSMIKALDLFVPKPDHTIACIAKTIHEDRFPSHELPEICFVGGSNVGKSSILKTVFSAVPNIRILTSKKPGHTKSMRFYTIGSNFCLLDLPGYGDLSPDWFMQVLESYLKNRKNLLKTFLLIDGTKGFSKLDIEVLNMFNRWRIQYVIALTKIDVVTEALRLKRYLELQNYQAKFESVYCFPQPFMFSSRTHEGLAYFLTFIAHITGNVCLEE